VTGVTSLDCPNDVLSSHDPVGASLLEGRERVQAGDEFQAGEVRKPGPCGAVYGTLERALEQVVEV